MTTWQELAAATTKALNSLGDTPEQVADTLTHVGITGERDHDETGSAEETNPIAVYLKHHLNATCSATSAIDATVVADGPDGEICAEGIELPDAVADFLEQFNAGQWPHLEVA